MNIRSINFRIVSLSIVSLLATVGAVVGYGVYSSQTTNEATGAAVSKLLAEESQRVLQETASTQAGHIRDEVDTAFNAARNMAQAFETMVDGKSASAPRFAAPSSTPRSSAC